MRISMLIICSALLASTLPAKTNVDDPQQKLIVSGYSAKGGGIVEAGVVSIKGREITTASSVTQCRGECEMTVHNILFKADELDFHSDGAEVEARGNVRVKVLPLGAAAPQKP